MEDGKNDVVGRIGVIADNQDDFNIFEGAGMGGEVGGAEAGEASCGGKVWRPGALRREEVGGFDVSDDPLQGVKKFSRPVEDDNGNFWVKNSLWSGVFGGHGEGSGKNPAVVVQRRIPGRRGRESAKAELCVTSRHANARAGPAHRDASPAPRCTHGLLSPAPSEV